MNKRKGWVAVLLFLVSLFPLLPGLVRAPLAFAAAPQTAPEYYAAGKRFQAAGDYYAAVEQFQMAVTANSSYADAWFALAECFYALGEYRLCLADLDNAERYIKNRTDVPNLRGFAYIGLGDTENARKTFEAVLARYPNDIDSRFGLAELEILQGRLTGAEKQYREVLVREGRNRRALVSLALVSDALGKKDAAREYIRQAINFHSEDAEVYYFAARLAVEDSDITQAKQYVERAIALNLSYDNAYVLYESILYECGLYEDCLAVCSYRLRQNRNLTAAWYVRGLCYKAIGNATEAMNSFKTGLSVDPGDEVMRMVLELLVLETLPIENSYRAPLAAFHAEKARDFIKKYSSVEARYEYQRSLHLNPLAVDIRLDYAKLLLSDGYAETYLAELEFVAGQGRSTVEIDDTIEAYRSLLYSTLPSQWRVNPILLDKHRWKLGVYYQQKERASLHPDSLTITVSAFCDIFSSSAKALVEGHSTPVSSFTEAFSLARKAGYDYFCLMDFTETERETTITLDMYSARTGNKAASWNVYRTGNDRYASALRRLRECVVSALPYYCVLMQRKGAVGLIDAGRLDGVHNGDRWAIVPEDALYTSDQGLGVEFAEEDVLGYFVVDRAGEEISEGTIIQNGFYDRISEGDVLVLVSEPETGADGDGNAAQGTTGASRTAPFGIQLPSDSAATTFLRTRPLLDLLRQIR